MTLLPKIPTDIDWARLAAYIDGEGNIRISLKAHSKNPSFMGIQICNTDMRLMLWMTETFGGKVIERKHKISGRCRIWAWYSYAEHAYEVLHGCLPYFIMKRDQAEQALAYQKLIRIHKERMGAGKRLLHSAVPDGEMQARIACVDRLNNVRELAKERVA